MSKRDQKAQLSEKLDKYISFNRYYGYEKLKKLIDIFTEEDYYHFHKVPADFSDAINSPDTREIMGALIFERCIQFAENFPPDLFQSVLSGETELADLEAYEVASIVAILAQSLEDSGSLKLIGNFFESYDSNLKKAIPFFVAVYKPDIKISGPIPLEGLRFLAHIFEEIRHPCTVNCENSGIIKLYEQGFNQFIGMTPYVTTLILKDNELGLWTEQHWLKFVAALTNSTSINSLNLANN